MLVMVMTMLGVMVMTRFEMLAGHAHSTTCLMKHSLDDASNVVTLPNLGLE